MSDISEWSVKEAENTHLDELTLSGEGGLYVNKIMCAVKGDADSLDDVGFRGTLKQLEGGVDYNEIKNTGFYSVGYSASNANGPHKSASILIVFQFSSTALLQICKAINERTIYFRHLNSTTWTAWQYIITDNNIGDGISESNKKISVPEYSGATEGAAGTAGLVPPATSAQRTYFLNGAGEWVDLLTLIGS